MKVFLSFSGSVSHEVAQAFYWWLPRVIQSLQPFMSSVDVQKGARWSTDIGAHLQDTHHGILMVTKENVLAAWLNFEAGALSKSLEESRVTPFLFNVPVTSLIGGPLAQFQATRNAKEDILALVSSLNREKDGSSLELDILNEAFEVWWPKLESQLAEVADRAEKLSEKPKESPKVDQTQLLLQVYEMQLSLRDRIGALERSQQTPALFTNAPPSERVPVGPVGRQVRLERELQRRYPNAPYFIVRGALDHAVQNAGHLAGSDSDVLTLADHILGTTPAAYGITEGSGLGSNSDTS